MLKNECKVGLIKRDESFVFYLNQNIINFAHANGIKIQSKNVCDFQDIEEAQNNLVKAVKFLISKGYSIKLLTFK